LVTFNLKKTFLTDDNEYDNMSMSTLLDYVKDPGDHHFDEIPVRRDAVGADIAILVEDVDASAHGMSDVMATSETAFGVVDYCFVQGYNSIAHEIGHLMGLRDDPQADPRVDPYPEGHGFVHDAGVPLDRWRTIMAVEGPGRGRRIMRWS